MAEKYFVQYFGIKKENIRFTSLSENYIMKTYLRHKSMNVIDIKELIALEYLDFEGKYKDYSERHDFWEICFVEKGEITIFLDGEGNELSENEIIVISPETEHLYFSDNGNINRAFVICFECSSQSMKSLNGNISRVDGFLYECIRTVIEEYKTTFRINENDEMELLTSPEFGGQQAIIIQIEYILICLLRKLSGEKNSEIVFIDNDNFYSELTDVIKKYLRKNIGKKLSLDDVCNKVNYSHSFICKTFKKETGETVFSFFNRLKVDEAKRLLADTEMSVSEISANLGFTEIKYFGALFKKITGITPTDYRKITKSNK